jgi:hypothetical protein
MCPQIVVKSFSVLNNPVFIRQEMLNNLLHSQAMSYAEFILSYECYWFLSSLDPCNCTKHYRHIFEHEF